MSQGRSGIGFMPYKGYIVLEVPEHVYPKVETPSEEAWRKLVDGKAQDATNGELTVAAVGEGVEFVKIGEKVGLASHSRIQHVETKNEDSKYPTLWWIVRESDILVKYD